MSRPKSIHSFLKTLEVALDHADNEDDVELYEGLVKIEKYFRNLLGDKEQE